MTTPTIDFVNENTDIKLPQDLRVVMVGAGISGIVMGAKLLEAGVKHLTVLEKASGVGGTWWHNRYPGASCDFNAHHYSFSFHRNPNWSSTNPPAAELSAYMDRVVDSVGLRSHIQFEKEVVRSEFQGDEWRIDTSDGEVLYADVFISAIGFLHVPKIPDFPGMSDFKGEMFHSSNWNPDLDLTGKRVANIGNGSTTAQVVPAIVDEVDNVTVFQRTAQWILPIPREPYSEEERAAFREDPSKIEQLHREKEEEVTATFGHGVLGDEEILEFFRNACQEYLDQTVTDPELHEKLQPHYPVACKRLIMAIGYYEAMMKPNADLITEPISRITENGIQTTDGEEHEFDVIVFSTGFKTHEYIRPLGLVGEGGITVDQAWVDGAQSFQAVGLAGFPNFFMLGGPHSPVGNYSFVSSAELQATHVVRVLDMLAKKGAKTLAPKLERQKEFVDDMLSMGKSSVWQSGCRSWYIDEHGNIDIWARSPEDYIEMFVNGPNPDDYVFNYDGDRESQPDAAAVSG